MIGTKVANWAYTEDFIIEDPLIRAARARGVELGSAPTAPGTGATLRFLAQALGAKSVVEVGTGTGVAAMWLLQGMPDDAVLTTIDVEVEHQRAAKEAFAEAGIKSSRARVISGRALDVLPRLTDGVYDLVFIDADPSEAPEYLEQAVRLLRPGGVVAIDNALWRDHVADPARRDELTTTMRELDKSVRADERLTSVLLPCGEGLLLASKIG